MVNKVVFDYLSQNISKYPIEGLRKKILDSGYSLQDFDESFNLLKSQTASSEPVLKDVSSPKTNSFKWMKFAAILGLVFLIMGIIFPITGYLLKDFFIQNYFIGLAFIILLFIMIIFSLFFFYGFARLGKYAGSRLLSFASKSIMVLIVLATVLDIIILFIVLSFVNSFLGSGLGLTGNAINNSDLSFFGSAIASNLFSSGLGSFGTTALLIMGIFGLLILFTLIVIFCFFIGLILAGKEVRFAKGAGILGLILMVLLIISPSAFFMMSFSDSSNFLEILATIGLIYLVIFGVMGIISLVTFLLMIFALFSASRKFEC